MQFIQSTFNPITTKLTHNLTTLQNTLTSLKQDLSTATLQFHQKFTTVSQQVKVASVNITSLTSTVNGLKASVSNLEKQIADLKAGGTTSSTSTTTAPTPVASEPVTTTAPTPVASEPVTTPAPTPVASEPASTTETTVVPGAGRLLVFNESNGTMSTTQIKTWIIAMNQVLPTFYADWPVMSMFPNSPGPVLFFKTGTYAQYVKSTEFNIKDYIFVFATNSDIADAAGYHTVTMTNDHSNRQVIAFTFVKTIMSSGRSQILYSNNPHEDVVGAVQAHEVFEALVDPYGNLVADNRLGTTGIKGYFDAEVSDMCQGTKYQVTIAGTTTKVTLSDYVLPNWFVPVLQGQTVRAVQYNKVQDSPVPNQTITKPFQISVAGYAQVTLVVNGVTNRHSTTFWGPPITQDSYNRPAGAKLAAKSGLMMREDPDTLEKVTDSSLCTQQVARAYPGAQIYGYRKTGDKRKYALRHNGETVGVTLRTAGCETKMKCIRECLIDHNGDGKHDEHDHDAQGFPICKH